VYNDLGHPPATTIGNQYAWRTADGSHNNVNLPEMGKVGHLVNLAMPLTALLITVLGWHDLCSFSSAISSPSGEPIA
jgi:hypothetical protein